ADNIQNFETLGAPVGRYYTWSFREIDTSQSIIKAKRLDDLGSPITGWAAEGNPVFQKSTTHQFYTDYVGLSGQHLLLFIGEGGSNNSYAQMVNPSGDLPWGLSGLQITGSQQRVYGAFVDAGGITFGYELNQSSSTGMHIQTVRRDGSFMYPAPGLALDMSNLQACAGMEFGRFTEGGLLVAWSARYNSGVECYDMYYRTFNPAGEALETEPQLLCSAPDDQKNPHVAQPSGTAMYVSWADARADSQNGVHLQKVSFGGSAIPDEPQVPATQMLKSLYPNPFSTSVNICWTQKDSTPAQCSIYNIRGQLVKRFAALEAKSGEHLLLWNGEDKLGRKVSPGVYIIKVKSGDWTKSGKILKW
ncbi:MAG: T9SS type A sorting domain-containing protein, partial [Candidatus Cloacimonetes bacterium]|nr:T9SS type A sorting domain-containing protein [Candidatus Cloacimonadota bacterium]